MSTPLWKYTSKKLVTEQSDHTNHAGVETISLSIIAEGYKYFAVGGSSYPFGSSGACLDNTTSHQIVIHSNQAGTTIARWGHGDQNIFLFSLESRTEARSGVLGRSINDGIGMNPPRTIEGTRP